MSTRNTSELNGTCVCVNVEGVCVCMCVRERESVVDIRQQQTEREDCEEEGEATLYFSEQLNRSVK